MSDANYRVTVNTSDETKAGTDLDVWCQIVGTEGRTVATLFDKGGYNDFESGDSDGYLVVDKDVGEITHIVFVLISGRSDSTFVSGAIQDVFGDIKPSETLLKTIMSTGDHSNGQMWKLSSAAVSKLHPGGPSFDPISSGSFLSSRWINPGDMIMIPKS